MAELDRRRPFVYLDTCGIDALQRNDDWFQRFFAALEEKGTVMVGVPLLIESAEFANTDTRAGRQRVLSAIGERWAPARFNPFDIIRCEQLYQAVSDGPPLPKGMKRGDFMSCCLDHSFREKFVVQTGSKSLAAALQLGEDVVGALRKQIGEVRASLLQLLAAPPNLSPPACPTGRLLDELRSARRRAVERTSNQNDAFDYQHAAVSLVHADIAVLDRKWLALAKQCESARAQVFCPSTKKTLPGFEAFLDSFLSWPSRSA